MYKLLRIISFLSVFVPVYALLAMDHSEDEKEEAATQGEREHAWEQAMLNEALFTIAKLNTPIEKEHIYIAVKVIEQKADVNAQNTHGVTPLIQASIYGNKEIAILLLKAGANVNCKSCYLKSTPLSNAVHCKHSEMVKLLIENGAWVNEIDNFGNTALIEAVYSDNEENIVTLLCAGANVGIKNGDGKTVFNLIREWGDAKKNAVFLNAQIKVRTEKERVSSELCALAHMLHDQVIETTPQLVDGLSEIIVDYMVPYLDIESPYRFLNRSFIGQEWIKIKDTIKQERLERKNLSFVKVENKRRKIN